MVKRKETDIQRAICEYLKARGYFFTRTNNTPVFDPRAGKYRAMPKYTLRGMPDILVLKEGTVIGIEVKSETGKQSPAQKEFQKRWEFAGGKYFIARGINDVMDQAL